MFVEVAVPVYVHQTFTYSLPPGFGNAKPGARVLVPFGSQLLVGYVVALHNDQSDAGLDSPGVSEIRDVEELFDTEPLVSEAMLELTKWIADYYYAPWGEVIKACLPAGINAEPETILEITEAGRAALSNARARAQLSAKMQMLSHLARTGRANIKDLRHVTGSGRIRALHRQLELEGLVSTTLRLRSPTSRSKVEAVARLNPDGSDSLGKPLTRVQQRVIDEFSEGARELSLSELRDRASVGTSVIQLLEKRGLIQIFERQVRRDPLKHVPAIDDQDLNLTQKQQAALDEIRKALDSQRHTVFLLHGLTGSGKTEVYIRAMREAVDRGRTALMLVPEISLTPVFSRRLRAHFGDLIAILHSSLSDGERFDEWQRLRNGEARVCIGARSAVFAPLECPGVIVIDEEHESSYKQDETPRYHGRDTAIVRALQSNAIVILGSATPSMESFHNAQTGKYKYLTLDERIGGRALASVEVVDMREVFARSGKSQVFSEEMRDAITSNFERQEQTMVLLNRRGFSSSVLCRSCGNSARCPNCDVSLTYHRTAARLICHYCDHQARVPRTCPVCDGVYIHFVGEGTEKIEAMLSDIYPAMRIARLDRDTTRRRGAFEQILGRFGAGDIDLLVGTQMIAKGHDYPNVTLVCVVSVDAGLALPDFRAAERTFQLLTQVAGRAGRGDKRGRVLIQSFHPEHYALEYAREQMYEKFYKREIAFRQGMHYPPLVALINIIVHHAEYNRAAELAAAIAKSLREVDSEHKEFRVLGPALAPLARLRGEHRLQILIKTKNRKRAREALDQVLERMRESSDILRNLTIEVDPVSLM